MAFFISDFSSSLGPILAIETTGSLADISGPSAEKGADMKKGYVISLYTT